MDASTDLPTGGRPADTTVGAEWVDLTRTLRSRGPHSGTQPTPLILGSVSHEESAASRGGGFSTASMVLVLSDHAGTHADAWNHMDPRPDALDVASMPLENFVGIGTAVDASAYGPGEVIPASVLASALDAAAGDIDAVLVRTGAVAEPPQSAQAYLNGFPGLGQAAVEQMAERGIRILGTDARSIDTAASESGSDIQPAHRACLAHQVVVLENLLVPEWLCGQVFELIAMPLKIAQGTGSPVRAVARLRRAH
jgi:kynurenine formamidase